MPAHVPPVADERTNLIAFLAQQRTAVKTAAYGLTDAEAGLAPSASALSVGGLVKHLTGCERSWMDTVMRREREAGYDAYVNGFVFTAEDSIADVIAEYDAACRETDETIAAIADLGDPVPVPDAPWFPKDVDFWSVRWVLLHLIEETARHAGHADIVRESIDGASSGALLAAAEGWAPTPWLEPWTPAQGPKAKGAEAKTAEAKTAEAKSKKQEATVGVG